MSATTTPQISNVQAKNCLMLNKREVNFIKERLRKVYYANCSAMAIGKVIELATTLAGCDPCEQYYEEIKQLSAGYTIGGLGTAMDIIGGEVCYQIEKIEEVLEEAGAGLPEVPFTGIQDRRVGA